MCDNFKIYFELKTVGVDRYVISGPILIINDPGDG